YISDMLIALTRATPEQAFLLRAHVGNYSLFISGIFHEHTQRRSLRGGPDIKFYEQVGRTNFDLVASHATARHCELEDVFEELAGAHISAAGRRSTLRWYLLFALADRTARTTRPARRIEQSQYPVAYHVCGRDQSRLTRRAAV